MTDRPTPIIGDVVKDTSWDRPITEKEAKRYLKRKKLPITKVNIRRAKKQIRNARKREWLRTIPRGRDVSVSQTDAPWQVIYGETRVSGYITFLHTTGNKTQLNHIITYCCHECQGIQSLYFDNELVEFAGGVGGSGWAINKYLNKVFLGSANTGSDSQTAEANCSAYVGTDYWGSQHRQRGRAHAYLLLVYNRELFAEGQPDIDFLVRGKKCYDPRNGTTVWTDNPALCIADYLTNTLFGCKIPSARIDWDSVSEAANICDQSVSLLGGGTEKRYTLNGKFDADLSHQEVLEQMAMSMAGNIVFSNNKWRLIAGAYRTPTISLTEENLMSEVSLTTMISKQEIFNGVKGTFISKDNSYEPVEFSAVKNSSYAALDGQDLFEDITLNFTTSSTMAQRIGKIMLEDIRRQIKLVASWDLKAFELNLGDSVQVTLADFGFVNKVFEVVDYDLELQESGVILTRLALKEIDSNIWAWDINSDENAITTAPTTSLPDPSNVIAPSALTLESGTDNLYLRKDGTVFSRLKVSWTEPADPFVTESGKIQIQHKLSSSGTWQPVVEVDGNFNLYYILDVQENQQYDVRIRSVNGVGVPSSWVSASHVVAGKTLPPSDVAGISGLFEEFVVKLNWDAITDLDLRHYEIRRGTSDWAASTFIAEVRGTSYVDNYKTAGTIKYFIKAIDTSGNYSNNAASVSIVITAPNPVQNLICESVDNHVMLDWEAPVAGDFPIARYNIYKGATFGTAELLGSSDGTFESFFERVGGEYTYWVTSVDTAGNESSEVSITRTIYDPPDFVLQDDQILTIAGGTFVNSMLDDGIANAVLAMVNLTETWTQHFTNNSWTTIQDQINAGYPIYIEPSLNSGSYEKTIDYGADLPPSLCRLAYDTTIVVGTITVAVTISWKLLSGDSWNDISGSAVFIPSAFRYIKYKLDFTGAANNDVAKYSNLNAVLEVKKQKDSGYAQSNSGSLVTVTFNKDFIDVKSIQVTPASSSGSDRLTPVLVYDWTTPDVDQFQVKILDHNGTQVAKYFSWEAEGIVRPPT